MRPFRPLLALFAFIVSAIVLVSAPTAAKAVDITSTGPLTTVVVTPDLNCAVNHADDRSGEFFGDTACGTFVTDGTAVYGPSNVPAGSGVTGSSGYEAWSPESQTGPSGSGSAADPFTIVTTVTGGPFTVVQTDRYVIGQETTRTDIKVTSANAVAATVYRAADCYLQDNDSGRGRLISGAAPTCLASPNSPSPERIIQWLPLTAGSNHIVDNYSTVWRAIGSKTPLPDTVRSGDSGTYDNGAGISWSTAIAAGASASFSHLTVFSPTGAQPVTITKTASASQVFAGEQVQYTITVSNPSHVNIPLATITDMMPDGFSYVAGTTTGATTADPTASASGLTWDGPFIVPPTSDEAPGTVTLTFTATVSNTPGIYTNSVTAQGSEGATIIDATDVAPVEVKASTTVDPDIPVDPDDTTPPTTVPNAPTTTTPTTVPQSPPKTVTVPVPTPKQPGSTVTTAVEATAVEAAVTYTG